MPDTFRPSRIVGYSRRLLVTHEERLFFPVFLVGSVGIWSLYSFGVRQWLVTGFPVSLMLLYLAYSLRSKRYEYREDRLGDDLYYLGLLFTLVSLVHALYVFGAENAIGQIVSNFGIALLTTITGLALRVWLYEWRDDALEEPELRARIELAEAVDQLKVQLSSCVEDMNGFRLQLAQSLAVMVKNASDKVAAAIQDGLADVRNKAAAVKDAAELALAGLPGYLVKLNEEAAHLTAELEGVWQRIHNIKIPQDLLERELAPTIKALTRHARAVEKITGLEEEKAQRLDGALAALVSLVEQLYGQAQRIPQSTDALVEFSARIEKAQQEIEGLTAAISGARGELREGANETSQTLRRLAADSAADLEAARVNREALEKELEKSRETVARVHETLLSLVSVTIERLGNSGPRTDKSGL